MTATRGADETNGPMERVRSLRSVRPRRTRIRPMSADLVVRLRQRVEARVYELPYVVAEVARRMALSRDL